MFSIIIPTMQKNKKILNLLLDELAADSYVDEIIIIDNSLSGINYTSDKLKVIIPSKNLFVNPAWNLGVQNAKNKYIGILNDDLIFPKNYFKSVYEFIISSNRIGYIGLETLTKSNEKDFVNYPHDTELKFNIIKERALSWGSAIFFSKNNYFKIPNKLKIWCGDDFLFYKSMESNKINYVTFNSNVIHLHSLTSDLSEFDIIKLKDQLHYKKLNPNFKLIGISRYTFWENLFSIKNYYSNDTKYKIIYILGIMFSIQKLNR